MSNIIIATSPLSNGQKRTLTTSVKKFQEINSDVFTAISRQELEVLQKLIIDNRLTITELGMLQSLSHTFTRSPFCEAATK